MSGFITAEQARRINNADGLINAWMRVASETISQYAKNGNSSVELGVGCFSLAQHIAQVAQKLRDHGFDVSPVGSTLLLVKW